MQINNSDIIAGNSRRNSVENMLKEFHARIIYLSGSNNANGSENNDKIISNAEWSGGSFNHLTSAQPDITNSHRNNSKMLENMMEYNFVINNGNSQNEEISSDQMKDEGMSETEEKLRNSKCIMPNTQEDEGDLNTPNNVHQMSVTVNNDVKSLNVKVGNELELNEANVESGTKYPDTNSEGIDKNADFIDDREIPLTDRRITDQKPTPQPVSEKIDTTQDNSMASCSAEIKLTNLEIRSDSNGLPIISVIPTTDPRHQTENKVIILNATFTSNDKMAQSLVDTLNPLLSNILGSPSLFVQVEGDKNKKNVENDCISVEKYPLNDEKKDALDIEGCCEHDLSVLEQNSPRQSASEGDFEGPNDEQKKKKRGCFPSYRKKRAAN